MARPAPPLPVRDGVGPSCVVLPPGPWETIAECLAERFAAVSPDEWLRRIRHGEVVDDAGVSVTAARSYRAGLRIYYYRTLPAEAPVPFVESVLFRDEHIVVADKPHFLAVTPSGRHLQETLLVRLKRRLGIDTLAPVHRIDRETAGLVLFSIQPASRGAYQRLFAEHRVRKVYECIAEFRENLPHERHTRIEDDPAHFMRMREKAGVPNAQTRIDLIERHGDFARYALQPTTGKRHQLRVHAAALGMPIRGDRIYPVLQPQDTDDHGDPLRLLARALAFEDPVTGQTRAFESARRLDWPAHQ
jgi:tRNA pseudouridine32 synthase/23S rRNA pseudouridine746 synthase